MKILLVFILISLSSFAQDEVILTKVHSVEKSDQHKKEVMVWLTTGQVLWIDRQKKQLITQLETASAQRTLLKVNLHTKQIMAIFQTPSHTTQLQKGFLEDPLPYTPTVVRNEDALKNLFQFARRTSKPETQCFNRAHVWAYEWRLNHNLYSSKAWLFFTRKFIRKYKFDWWFHVAPMVAMKKEDGVVERILDMKYARGPLRLKQWTDIFIRDNADCPVVTRYSEYADFPEEGSCFILKSPMYYYQPIDLEDLELTGIQKTKWIRGEVQAAYREAFDQEH